MESCTSAQCVQAAKGCKHLASSVSVLCVLYLRDEHRDEHSLRVDNKSEMSSVQKKSSIFHECSLFQEEVQTGTMLWKNPTISIKQDDFCEIGFDCDLEQIQNSKKSYSAGVWILKNSDVFPH